jgi:hypothetical protein
VSPRRVLSNHTGQLPDCGRYLPASPFLTWRRPSGRRRRSANGGARSPLGEGGEVARRPSPQPGDRALAPVSGDAGECQEPVPRWARSWCGGGGSVMRACGMAEPVPAAGGPHANQWEERRTAPTLLCPRDHLRAHAHSVVLAGRGPAALMYLSGQGGGAWRPRWRRRSRCRTTARRPRGGVGRSTTSRTSGPPKRVICPARLRVGPGPGPAGIGVGPRGRSLTGKESTTLLDRDDELTPIGLAHVRVPAGHGRISTFSASRAAIAR